MTITDKDFKSLGVSLDSQSELIEAIASELEVIQASIPKWDLEVEEGEEEPWIDVRLRIFEGGWSVPFGDSGYDQDHRGLWGAGSLSESTDTQQLAEELLQDLIDHAPPIDEEF